MAAQYHFVMRSGPNAGKVYPLEGEELTIGRDRSNNISINDAEISRTHAKLFWQERGYTLEDLGSTNGTFINGQRVSAMNALRVGDEIGLGENVVLVYETAADPNATMVTARGAGRAKPAAQPKASPAPQAYAGQVPSGPQASFPKAEKKKLSPWLLVAIIAAVVICVCVIFFVIVDQLRLWCSLFPFLFPGAC